MRSYIDSSSLFITIIYLLQYFICLFTCSNRIHFTYYCLFILSLHHTCWLPVHITCTVVRPLTRPREACPSSPCHLLVFVRPAANTGTPLRAASSLSCSESMCSFLNLHFYKCSDCFIGTSPGWVQFKIAAASESSHIFTTLCLLHVVGLPWHCWLELVLLLLWLHLVPLPPVPL